jgi:magnesium-dependent phosphatase 1
MYTLSKLPSKDRVKLGDLGKHKTGVVGVYSGAEVIQLFPDALDILQDIYLGKYPGVRIAAASSADTPLAVKIGKAAMGILEILPGVTMREVFAKNWDEGFEGNIQIGRTPPLSSDKASTHFPILRRLTGINYDKMVFFDDCLWGDHCGRVESMCTGVVAVRTPDGLQLRKWKEALQRYAARAMDLTGP